MEYRNLGRSGLQVSVVGLGCNNFGRRMDPDQTAAVVNVPFLDAARGFARGFDVFEYVPPDNSLG